MHQISPAAISLVAGGSNIWAPNKNTILKDFKETYIFEYTALPMNTQFVGRGVKESSYVALGQRGESNQAILDIAIGKILPGALQNNHHEINDDSDDDVDADKKSKQLQGEKKTKYLGKN